MDDEYVSGAEAAELLGVTLTTIYAYVSRGRLRSQQLPGSKSHRYWRPDIERLRKRERRPKPVAGELRQDSEITLLTERGPYYRGRSAIELAESASLEAVAALLWDADERDVFTVDAPKGSVLVEALCETLATESGTDRAVACMCVLEQANPRCFDLSRAGMARSGADVVRWLVAIILGKTKASCEPIHVVVGRELGLDEDVTDLIRRILILSADHGFEQSTYAVRAVSATGVTPWRAVQTGLAVASGRRSKFGLSGALRRLMEDITASADPVGTVVRRIREEEVLPGFASAVYPNGDPRARALFDYCDRIFANDRSYQRMKRALEAVRELQRLEPSFALAVGFSALQIADRSGGRFNQSETMFPIGRSVGWIAHAIEQYTAGEAAHRDLIYRGPMPIVK
jgi:citrate synthase